MPISRPNPDDSSGRMTCHHCGAPARSLHTRHAGTLTLNPDGSRHLCHPERVWDFTLGDLNGDEILLRSQRPERTYLVWESACGRPFVVLRAYEGERSMDERRLGLRKLKELGFFRALRYHAEKLPEPTLDAKHGWITPDGTLYPCVDFYSVGYSDHNRVAGLLEVALGLEDIGGVAIKVQDFQLFTPDLWSEHESWRPTEAQRRAAREYCCLHKQSDPHWLYDEGPEQEAALDRELDRTLETPTARRSLTAARLRRPLEGD
jgi:hypothetical protein